MALLVLEIEDPGCFWVAMKGCGPGIVDEMEYKDLNAKMNQFYDKSNKDRSELKPLKVEKGQVCVAFSEELKCWCRAVITSVMGGSDDYQTECFLVDYAKYVFVKSKDIRVALERFMKIPYRAKKCRLYRTKPVTLRIDFCADAAKIVPANRWDAAATCYFQNLLKATEMKAQLCAVEENTLDIFLYVTIKDEKVCVNDDLVSKNFARFEEADGNTGSSAEYPDNQTSLNVEFPPVKIINTARAFRPVLFHEKVSTNFETGLTVSRIFPEETYQRSSTGLNEYTEPIVKASPSLAFNKNTAVHRDRLQQFLNSDRLKTHRIEDHQQSCRNLSQEKNFVCLSNKIAPASTLETAPLLDDLRKELARKNFLGPSFTESYCWPPVARGCDVVAISCQGNDPLLYIPPVLTFLQLGNCYQPLSCRSGPLALILCPGWKKARFVFEVLKTYMRRSRLLQPQLIILGQRKEAARSLKIRECEIIVTTPYSLLKLLEHHSLIFCALGHLVLDEIEVLFSDATEQVFSILECYKKAISPEEWEYSVHQIIAVGTRWNKHTARLIKEFMNDPYIVITTVEEASIYGNVQQVLQPCRDSERTAVLLKILDFTHHGLQKVLVFTSSVNEAEMVHKALMNNSISSMKIHAENEVDCKCILEQWTKKYSSGTHVVLDDCMQSLGITDATCVVHFSFPSPRILGRRLCSMSDNFCNMIEDSSVDGEYTRARSVFLLTENNACHALEILHFLQRAEAEIPQELYDFTAKAVEPEEDKKFARPLCAYLKTFGICTNKTVCPDRHEVNMQIDVPQNIPDKVIQTPGNVTILPLHIVNATNYFGRIVDKENDQYTILAEEMKEYFKKSCNKKGVQNVEKLLFYGFCEKRLFHRVQVVEISPKEEENSFFHVKIKFIDEGRTSQAWSHQLLHLPARFQRLPPQAVEFIVCRVKPIDNEIEWNPKVTHYINYKIKGKLHEAKIIHILGNTAWVDPMVRVTTLPCLKTSVSEYNVRSEILSTGLGTDNPEHVLQLQKLCGCMKILDHEKNSEPLSIKEDTAGLENVSSSQNVSIQENSTETCKSSKTICGNRRRDDVAESKEAEDSTLHQHKCFYPEIKWFQSEETLTVKVRIVSIANWKCVFTKEKVVFSASSGDKRYLADMELHQHIVAEKSTCVIKAREAILVLVKEKKGAWSRLLKNKNPHVSSDFEHWEDLEDKSPFPVGTKKRHYTAAGDEEFTDSPEDSETESDE